MYLMNDDFIDCDELIEDALQSTPLEEPPAFLLPAIMRQVRLQADLPKFHLEWIDYALGFFGFVVLGLILVGLQFIPPQVRLQISWWLTHIRATNINIPWQPILAVVSAAGAFCIAAVAYPAFRRTSFRK